MLIILTDEWKKTLFSCQTTLPYDASIMMTNYPSVHTCTICFQGIVSKTRANQSLHFHFTHLFHIAIQSCDKILPELNFSPQTCLNINFGCCDNYTNIAFYRFRDLAYGNDVIRAEYKFVLEGDQSNLKGTLMQT